MNSSKKETRKVCCNTKEIHEKLARDRTHNHECNIPKTRKNMRQISKRIETSVEQKRFDKNELQHIYVLTFKLTFMIPNSKKRL